MNQPDLFREESSLYVEAARRIDNEGNVHPARSTDMQTSHQAANRIKPRLSQLQAVMLRAFAERPMTDQEAAAWCVQHHREKTLETYRKRAGEIRTRLQIVGTRKCAVTGNSATVWRAK